LKTTTFFSYFCEVINLSPKHGYNWKLLGEKHKIFIKENI